MKTCNQCRQTFVIADEDRNFYKRMALTVGTQKYPIPEPTLCPDCRQQRRLAFRNERHLYRRQCDLCKKSILSIFSPDKPYLIYCPECWWSDSWDPLEFGRPYDFSKSFFQQFDELMKAVPQLALMNVKSENSEYTNQGYANKNCYMTIATDQSEDCYYLDYSFSCKNSVDSLSLHTCQYCYECIACTNSYECFFSQDLTNCRQCSFSRALRNCQNCFGCTNLRNKEYYFFNKPVSKEKWHKKVSSLSLTASSIFEIQKRATELRLTLPHKAFIMTNCIDCSGNYLGNSKNAKYCFDGKNIEDSKYCTLSPLSLKNCYDISGGAGELLYECFATGGPGQHLAFCGWCWIGISDLAYCVLCMNSTRNCFGCVSLKRKEYCILNRQYSKEEYEKLVPKIIEHMGGKPASPPQADERAGERDAGLVGPASSEAEPIKKAFGEFFPGSISPFGYNETSAQENYPLMREQALAQNFKWSEYQIPIPDLPRKPASEIPETNEEITDELLNYVFECETSGRPFRFIKQELDFHKQFGLPLPRKHPEIRSLDRFTLRNPRKLWPRECARCAAPIETSYAPDRPEIVYCEKCYLQEVY